MNQESSTTSSKHLRSPQFIDQVDALVREAGGDPEHFSGRLLREMVLASLRLLPDGADLGELKLLNRAFRELRYAMKVYRQYPHKRKISIFGSARTPVEHPDYQAAVQLSRTMKQADWMITTGAGDGIMRAGHDGAGPEASFGVGIKLPFEANANDLIAGDEKYITFRYFFTRKLMFVWHADAVALFPGGFGTHDEGFEVLTLVQTGKAPIMPIVMIDAPGEDYWANWDQYVRTQLLARGWISPEDLSLYHVTDNPDQAAQHILQFYRVYHSQRYVGDDLVMRLTQPVGDKLVENLSSEFSDLLTQGGIEQTGPLEGENELMDLPRLKFRFDRRSYGRLRQLIDRINESD